MGFGTSELVVEKRRGGIEIHIEPPPEIGRDVAPVVYLSPETAHRVIEEMQRILREIANEPPH